VPDARIERPTDVLVRITSANICGSDLHLLGGYIPAMRAGDVLGHEFMGTVAEVGPDVTKHKVGDRVVVVSFTVRLRRGADRLDGGAPGRGASG
jgi:threonine dehydrogenase-like Zn-dependent dehydrogenase